MGRFNQMACFLATVTVCASAAAAEPPAKKSDPGFVRPRIVGAASDSGGFSLDESKLHALFPEFEWTADQLAYLDEHLKLGDSRAAIVASVKPLVVSAYSDELDGVILIKFPDDLVTQYSLNAGDELIASWVYPRSLQAPRDVEQGDRNSGRYSNGAPIVADFFSNSVDKIKKRKSGVSKEEWERVRQLTPPAFKQADGKYRSSFPLDARLPPELLKTASDSK
jgi:hypothetical protein